MARKDEIISVEAARDICVKKADGKKTVKQLIDACIKTQGLGAEERRNNAPGAPLIVYKCRFGEAISKLLRSGYLVKDDEGRVSVANKPTEEILKDANRDEAIEKIIKETISAGDKAKRELFGAVSQRYKATDKAAKRIVVNADAGRILKRLVDSGEINKKGSVFSIKKKLTEREKLNRLNPQSLVVATVEMLTEFYKKAHDMKIVVSKATDGPADGGIDGVIEYENKMGYREKAILQVKCCLDNKEKYVKQCEIREFQGVFSVTPDATTAIFVTNGKYHKDTEKFVRSCKRFILIDGEKWCQVAEKCGYKIKEE